MGNGNAAFGTTLTRAGVTIADIYDIGGVSTDLEMKDITTHGSADRHREQIGTLLKAGDVPIKGYFYPGDTNGQIGLRTDQLAVTLQAFVITLPAAFATTWTFNAYVSHFETGSMVVDGVIEFAATLAITGKPVLAITASNNATALSVADNVGAATLAPVFAAGTYAYVVTMAAAAVTYTITVTFAAGVCTITDGNGGSQTVLSTVPSSSIAVTPDSFHNTTVTIKETGKTAKVYTLHMLRP